MREKVVSMVKKVVSTVKIKMFQLCFNGEKKGCFDGDKRGFIGVSTVRKKFS